jgi:phospholipid/cholesterol/gamma-HCH transport system substrate-binding protein
MMENKAHAFAAGIFVLLATALVVGLAAWLSRDMAGRTVYEIATTGTVTGLQPQAAVRYRGVSVGKVERIGFDDQQRGQVLIRIAVDQNTPVTTSTFATLDLQGVTGLTFVQLDDTGASNSLLTSDATKPARIPLRAGLLTKLSDRGSDVLERADETAKRLNQLLDDQNQKALITSVQQIGQAAQSLSQVSASLNTAVPALSQGLNKTLQSLQATSGDIAKAANAATQSAAEFGKGANAFTTSMQRINDKGGALDKLSEASASLAESAQQLNANTLPRAGRTLDESSRAARQLSRTAKDLSDNPQSLIYGNGSAAPGPGESGFTAPKAAAQGVTQ